MSKNGATAAGTYLGRFSPSYSGTADGNQQKSNDVYAVGKNYGEDIKKSYDRVYNDTINVDPTPTGYGKNVLATYQNAANEAYNKTLASGTEDAGGNVDSYAAANANRQKAAMVSGAHDDILNYYNAISGRASDWAQNRSSDLSKNLSQLQGNVDNDRTSRQIDVQSDNERYATDTERYLSELGYKSENDDRSYDRETSLRDYLTTLVNAYGAGVLDFIDDNGNFDRAKLAAARNEDGTYGPDHIAFKGGLSAASTSAVGGNSSGSGIRSTASGRSYSSSNSGSTASDTTTSDDPVPAKAKSESIGGVTTLETLDDVKNWVKETRKTKFDQGTNKFNATYNQIYTAAAATDGPEGYIRNLALAGNYSKEAKERGLTVDLYAYTPTKMPFETLVQEAVSSGVTKKRILERLKSQYDNGQYTDAEYEKAITLALGEKVAKEIIEDEDEEE